MLERIRLESASCRSLTPEAASPAFQPPCIQRLGKDAAGCMLFVDTMAPRCSLDDQLAFHAVMAQAAENGAGVLEVTALIRQKADGDGLTFG